MKELIHNWRQRRASGEKSGPDARHEAARSPHERFPPATAKESEQRADGRQHNHPSQRAGCEPDDASIGRRGQNANQRSQS
jgi:hypothetical protein